MKNRELNILVINLIKQLKGIGIPISNNISEIKINNRAKARFGACKVKKSILGKSFMIEISSEILECDTKMISEVIIHELLHTCPGCFNHGKKWKLHASKVESLLGYRIKTTQKYEDFGLDRPEQKEEVKYVVKCTGCGAEFHRKRLCKLVKNPEKYRCGKCGNILYLQGKKHNIL